MYEHIIHRREGMIAHLGPIVTRTGHYTGRSPNDKFIVREPKTEDKIWWGKVNRPFPPENYEQVYWRLQAYIQDKDIYVQDCYAGADPKYRIPIRIVTESAWASLFARNMFIREREKGNLDDFEPEYTLIAAPGFHAIPDIDKTNSEAFILANFGKKMIIIGGTSYAGEIKKSIFTVMNFVLPQKKVLSMHCSANIGKKDDVALFFGLSGTGKTTLSTDPERYLIGDDEHGWSEDGIFNFEGGCYAKVIKLDPNSEPEIFQCTRKFGTILENVAIDIDSRRIDLNDNSLTENTRAAYPISHIPNIKEDGMGGHPKNLIMLTCDAFGVLPPIGRMTPDQARYHFISGYTAKVAGTERGIKEPQATFSACFGAPFMALHPTVYADLLGERIAEHNVKCWLVNTGWSGGPFGVGERMSIKHTRAILNAALTGALDDVPYIEDPIFGVQIPQECPGVPKEVLNPKETWADKAAYDEKAAELARLFNENFEDYKDKATKEIIAASPKTPK
jgi:phosphoenolpyruvate carboxykinase (ATP)